MFPSMSGNAAKDGNSESMLHGHRFLLRAGLAIGNVFAWVFVFEYFFLLSNSIPRSLAAVFLMYALSQAITIVMTPIGATQLRYGTRRSLVWAVVLSGSAFVFLGGVLGGYFTETPAQWGIAVFAVFLGAYRALYFAPYALNRKAISEFGLGDRVFYEFLLALIPAFVGATLLYEAYAPLKILFGAGALATFSAVPLVFLPNMYERFNFSYIQTFKELFSPRNARLVWLSFLEGIQGAVLFLVWPLIVFILVGWSYTVLGVIFTITLLSVMLFRSVYRRLISSQSNIARSTPVHVTLAVSGWMLRIVAGTPIGVIIADSYAHAVRPSRGTANDPFVFEQAADGGSYIDEYTVLKEMGLALGRIALVSTLYVLVFSVSVGAALLTALIAAGLAAGIAVVLARHHKITLA